MPDQKRQEFVEQRIGARIRPMTNGAQVDYLNFEGHVRNTRPASNLEIKMWDLLLKGDTYNA